MSIDPRSMQAPDPAQFDEYDRPRPLVPAGRYTAKAPLKFDYEDDEGFLRVLLDPLTLVGIPDGYRDQVRFERVSSKPRTTGRLAGTSRLADYLLATRGEGVRSSDINDWVDAIEATAGELLELNLDWRAYDSEEGEVLAQSYEDFPSDGNGGRQSWIVNPRTGKKVAAQYRVRYFVRRK